MKDNNPIVFQDKTIRRTSVNDEWFFSVADVVAALTDSINPSDYIKKLRRRDPILAQGWGQIVTPLSVETAGGARLRAIAGPRLGSPADGAKCIR